MSHVDSYRDLHVWQKSMDLVTECYRIAKRFPQDERFGLCSQLQRAAVSVPANIAEGNGRGSTQSYLNHLWIANVSATFQRTRLLRSCDPRKKLAAC